VASEQFQCPDCSQKFASEDDLDQHIAEMHPMAPVPGDEMDDRPDNGGRSLDSDSPETRDDNPARQY